MGNAELLDLSLIYALCPRWSRRTKHVKYKRGGEGDKLQLSIHAASVHKRSKGGAVRSELVSGMGVGAGRSGVKKANFVAATIENISQCEWENGCAALYECAVGGGPDGNETLSSAV